MNVSAGISIPILSLLKPFPSHPSHLLTPASPQVKKRQMSQFDCDKTLSTLITDTSYEKFKDLDIIIEAVPEDINLKHRIIKEVNFSELSNIRLCRRT